MMVFYFILFALCGNGLRASNPVSEIFFTKEFLRARGYSCAEVSIVIQAAHRAAVEKREAEFAAVARMLKLKEHPLFKHPLEDEIERNPVFRRAFLTALGLS